MDDGQQEASKELGKIARSLRPGGALYLFNQPLVPVTSREPADQLTRILRANHFSIREVLFEDLRPVPAFCVVAEPA